MHHSLDPFPVPIAPCKSCGGSRRLLLSIGQTLCMRCAACLRCGSKFKYTARKTLDESCLLCGDKTKAQGRAAIVEAQPLTGSMVRLTDSARVTVDAMVFVSGRLGPPPAGLGREPLPTEMKILRRTDGRFVVYGGPSVWPHGSLYVAPTLMGALLEMVDFLSYSQDSVAVRAELLRVGRLAPPRVFAALPSDRRSDGSGAFAARRKPKDSHLSTAGELTPPAKARGGRRYLGCGHRRVAAGPDRCPACRQNQTLLNFDPRKAEGP